MKHIFRGTTAPTFAPRAVGHHYVNTTNGDQYLSKGYSSPSDWVLVSQSIDDKVKVADTDTTHGYLLDKISAGDGIVLTEQNISGNETLQISVTGSALTDEKVKISATDTTTGYLQGKIIAGTGITVTQENVGGNEDLKIATTITQYTDEQAQDAVGNSFVDTSTIDFTYTDASNQITANLKNTTVSAGSYGSATQVPNYTVDAQGRLTAASNTSIAIPSTQITDFTEATQDAIGNVLVDSTSIDFTYSDVGNSITAAVLPGGVDHNALLNWTANKHIDHSTVSLINGTGISATGLGDLTASRTINLANTAVTASSYGSATQVATFTVNAQGQLTAAANTSIAIPSTQVTDFTESVQDAMGGALVDSASVDFQYNDVANTQSAVVIPGGVDHNSLLNWVANKHIDHSTVSLVAGTGISATGLGDITASRTINLANTAVTASSYGSATQVATFTVNAQGQLTAAANTSIAIPSTQITDFTESVQDAIGGAWADTSSIDFTYNDAGNSMSAVVLPGGVDHNSLLNWVANKHIDHSAVSLIAGTGISATGLGDLTASRTIDLTNTGVSAGTYGNGSNYPVITVDAQGRITSASTSSTISYPFVSTAEGPLWQDTTGLDLILEQINNDPEQSPFIQQRKSRGTSPATRTFLQSNDKIGSFGYMVWGGTGYNLSSSAEFQTRATENHTASAQGSEIRFQNTPNGTTSSSIRMTIKEYGDIDFSNAINIGTTTNTTDGNIRYTGTEFEGRANGVWNVLGNSPVSISATSASTTTSGTFSTINSMTSTPASGTYRLDFTCAVALGSSNSTGDFGVFIAGVEQTQCRRQFANGAAITTAGCIAISTLVTVNGSQAITIQFRENASATLTVNARELILTPISR